VKTLHHLATTLFLLVVLTSCASTPKPIESQKLTETTVPIQTVQPTQVVIPADLTFSTPLVQALSQSGLSVMSVQGSTYTALFPSTDQAVWIKTNKGIVEAVFFAESVEAEQIHITEQPKKTTGRYLYTIQAPPPILLHAQTIDAAFPLYFTVKSDMLMITSSEELDKTLRQIFLEQ
jgi:PBP1b-binding outer membrane lipoprotein LpoB